MSLLETVLNLQFPKAYVFAFKEANKLSKVIVCKIRTYDSTKE